MRSTCHLVLLFLLSCAAAVRADETSDRGAELFRVVVDYAALGDHRAGTEVDARTLDWFAAALQRIGGTVERQPFDFQRFDGSSRVTIYGQAIDSLPLYYEGIGEVHSDHPFVAALDPLSDHSQTSDALNAAIAQAKAAGADVAVVATLNPLAALQIPNRTPQVPGGLPVVLVPSGVAERIQHGAVHVDYSGRIVPGHSANVMASFGDQSQPPIVLATPLSGWFRCAAERGTGIAVTMALAQRLAAQGRSVLVVGTSAHELPYLGLEAFVRAHHLTPRLVIHLGANVALGEAAPGSSALQFAAHRVANVRMPSDAIDRLRASLAMMQLQPTANPPLWFGESKLWVESQPAPVISFVGLGPQFHTPLDVPQTTTSPDLLRRADEGIGGAIDAFLAQ